MSSGLQVVTEFVTEVRRFILINSDYKPVMSRWAGRGITVPGSEEVVKRDPNDPTVFASAMEKDGTYIPGTLVVMDRYDADGEGGDRLAFDAGHAVRYILGVQTRTGLANSMFARRGLSLLPRGSTRKDLERIRKAGHARSEVWRIEQARTLIQDIDHANAKREAKKIPPIPGGPEYIQAVLELRNYHDREQRVLLEITKGPVTAPVVEPISEVEIDAGRLLADYLREQIATATEGVSMSENAREQMVEKLINDPKAMELLGRRFKMVERLVKVPKRKQKATETLSSKPIPEAPVAQAVELPQEEEEMDLAEQQGELELPRQQAPPEVAEPSMMGMSPDLPDHIKEKFNDPEPDVAEEKAPSSESIS